MVQRTISLYWDSLLQIFCLWMINIHYELSGGRSAFLKGPRLGVLQRTLYRQEDTLKFFAKGRRVVVLPKSRQIAVGRMRTRLFATPRVYNALFCDSHQLRKLDGTWWAGSVMWSCIKYQTIFMKTGFNCLAERNWHNESIKNGHFLEKIMIVRAFYFILDYEGGNNINW